MITKERIIELMMDNFFNDPEAILPGVNVNDAADDILAELEKERQETCKFTFDEINGDKIVRTGCNGQIWADSYNGDFKFCPYCGKLIEETGEELIDSYEQSCTEPQEVKLCLTPTGSHSNESNDASRSKQQ
jgi:hypothetical protein